LGTHAFRAGLQTLDEETQNEKQVAKSHDDEADCGEAGDDADSQQHTDDKCEDGDPNGYLFRRIDSHDNTSQTEFFVCSLRVLSDACREEIPRGT